MWARSPRPTRSSSTRASRRASSPQSRTRPKTAPDMTFSSASSEGSTRTSWKVRDTPCRAMACAGRPEMRRPSSRISPDVGGSAPEIRFSIVVLPEPFGPIRPSSSPCFTSKETSLTATRPPKALRAARMERAAVMRGAPSQSPAPYPPPLTPPLRGEGDSVPSTPPSPLWGSAGRARPAARPGRVRGGSGLPAITFFMPASPRPPRRGRSASSSGPGRPPAAPSRRAGSDRRSPGRRGRPRSWCGWGSWRR
jgi:hypothetical protein